MGTTRVTFRLPVTFSLLGKAVVIVGDGVVEMGEIVVVGAAETLPLISIPTSTESSAAPARGGHPLLMMCRSGRCVEEINWVLFVNVVCFSTLLKKIQSFWLMTKGTNAPISNDMIAMLEEHFINAHKGCSSLGLGSQNCRNRRRTSKETHTKNGRTRCFPYNCIIEALSIFSKVSFIFRLVIISITL